MPIKTDDLSPFELQENTVEGEGRSRKHARRRSTRRSVSIDGTRTSNVRVCLYLHTW